MLPDSEWTMIATPSAKDNEARPAHQCAHILQKVRHRYHPRNASKVIFAGVGRVSDGGWLHDKIDE